MGTIKRLPEYNGTTLPLDNPAFIAGQVDVLRCLGIGRVGTVYLCRTVKHPHQLIALKVLSPIHFAAGTDDRMFMRFRNEILSMFRVRHKNVVQIYEYINESDLLAYSMEYVDGGTLQTVLEQRTTLDIHETVDMLIKLCAGTKAIHDAGIVHRDLKPENILLSLDRRELKITDFGVSFSHESPNITAHGDAVGTVRYLSPEYLEQGIVGIKSDIYALGVIAYYMATGVLPHYEAGIFQTVSQKISTDPPAPHLINRDCPYSLSLIIQKAMARNPQERFESARVFHDSLLGIQDKMKGVVFSRKQTNFSPKSQRNTSFQKTENILPLKGKHSRNGTSRFLSLSAVGIFVGIVVICLQTFLFKAKTSSSVNNMPNPWSDAQVIREPEVVGYCVASPKESSIYSDWVLAGGGILSCIDQTVVVCSQPSIEQEINKTEPLSTVLVLHDDSKHVGSFEVSARRNPPVIEATTTLQSIASSKSKKQPVVKKATVKVQKKTAKIAPLVGKKVLPKDSRSSVASTKVNTVKVDTPSLRVEPTPEKFLGLHASFVERFIHFVQWRKVNSLGEPFDICVFSSPSMYENLTKRLAGKSDRLGRPYRISLQNPSNLGAGKRCEIAYIAGAALTEASNERLLKQGVVTVTEGSTVGVFGLLSNSHKAFFSFSERAAARAGVEVQPIVKKLAARIIH
jgi:serine/threonine protein kinase